MQQPKNKLLAERIKKWIGRFAVGSLLFDYMISVLTLVGNGKTTITYTINLTNISYWTNWGLTLIIVLTTILFLCFIYYRYEHVILRRFAIEK